ncbi:probable translation initiation factor eIF-2B subunit delta [Dendrobium catenatum]|uniref:probable translation initiation factor eIF-2B subunit delta n=1 Tax=Dendrobium catenatum TaxID=906689 RepID=UPI0009F21785|nr:probable translation initiation factor eIF-2B subunit delta [Dendrobium catenatum]
MDSRRLPRAVIDPKVRQVGFFTSCDPPPARSLSVPADTGASAIVPTDMSSSPPLTDIYITNNSFSSVRIPPPRQVSAEGLHSLGRAAGSTTSVFAHDVLSPHCWEGIQMPIGSYNSSEFMQGKSSMLSPSSSRFDDIDFSEEEATSACLIRTGSGKEAAAFPRSSGEVMMAIKSGANAPAKSALKTASVVKALPEVTEKDGGTSIEKQNEGIGAARSKQKTTKAERRAIQEVQRAAKAAAKDAGKGAKSTFASSGGALAVAKQAKSAILPSQTKYGSSVASERRVDRNPDKDGKKDVSQSSMQFDDKSRVEKAKRRAAVGHFEARNSVELFRHLPQYEHGPQLQYLESKFFHLDHIHPSVYKVGLQYLTGSTSGGNARCKEMLLAFQEAVMDYSTPPEKTPARDLTSKISSYVSFLIACRPLSISMGNAIRFLKNRIAKLDHNISESEAKSNLLSDIDRFINEKIIVADKVIVHHAVTKIRDGDVLLIYGHSTVVEMILLQAHELGKQFRIVVVDSRPKLEGKALLRKLVMKGLSCTYTHLNAISYIMHEVTRVFLGASSILSNGTIYSRVGTACVAMVSHTFRVPVLICCEAYKFNERVLLDSICSNELGDPDVISKVHGRDGLNDLENWSDHENLQLLNLFYDATPSDYVSMIVTEHGMIPPTSVPVIFREYGRDQLFF